ncbi:nicotinamide riboside transporter PnuC [Mangrovibacterium diazotrophicum]|uniref:Nicotinamide riboside transporter PnuC n=1 Tax=Mangrovibacterium diazotrophicum TaxID=1261403 RepID=A0A419W2N8_9BACT|nr:nicotinamide riboside transporter PnuC [Mangrovibacterium diazotrophicum]RKD89709.1 nicotinamide mononucleotide transporter [Mangrovibacterium diazotrophicum]
MSETITSWLVANWVEVTGTILGFVYIFLSIKQNILTWPVGLLSSALYVYVFFVAKFYADMALQVYYVVVSLYGWYFWLKGNPKEDSQLEVSQTPQKLWLWLVGASVLFFVLIEFVLQHYTDSPVPMGDALTTALSLVATWMLARKYLEHWLIWVFVDFFSAVLYAIKGLWPTFVLFMVYTVMAFVGYLKWRNELKTLEYESV